MTDIKITDIHQEHEEESDEETAYVLEYSIPDYSNTFRTDPIAAEEYSRDVAREAVRSEASVLLADEELTVLFPNEVSDSETVVDRRKVLKYGAGFASGAVLVGGASWWISPGRQGANNRQDEPAGAGASTRTRTDATTAGAGKTTNAGTTGDLLIDGFENGEFRDVWKIMQMNGSGEATVTADRAFRGDQSLRIHVGGDVNLATDLETDKLADGQTYFAWIYPADRWGKIIYRLRSPSGSKRADIRFGHEGNITYSTNRHNKTPLVSNPNTGQWYRLAITISPSSNRVDFTAETTAGDQWQATDIPATLDVNEIYLRGGDYTPNFTFYVDEIVSGVT